MIGIPRIMKTIRQSADTKPKQGNANTLSVNQCILFAKHFYTTVLNILVLGGKKKAAKKTL